MGHLRHDLEHSARSDGDLKDGLLRRGYGPTAAELRRSAAAQILRSGTALTSTGAQRRATKHEPRRRKPGLIAQRSPLGRGIGDAAGEDVGAAEISRRVHLRS